RSAQLTDKAILRQWLVISERRPADMRMAHLFCELFTRLKRVAAINGSGFPLPFTQEEIGDALGISTIHVNRILHELRDMGLITLSAKVLNIPDFDRLARFAGFSPEYLNGPCSEH